MTADVLPFRPKYYIRPKQYTDRDARDLFRAGVQEFKDREFAVASLFLGAAEAIFRDLNDPWNASVVRQWQNSIKDAPNP